MSRLFRQVALILFCFLPVSASAFTVPETYTNSNFFDSYQDEPQSFTRDELGNFSGVTNSGKLFTQQYVVTSISVRLQRFSIDKAFFYISDQGIISADSDIQALSVYLSSRDLSLEDFG